MRAWQLGEGQHESARVMMDGLKDGLYAGKATCHWKIASLTAAQKDGQYCSESIVLEAGAGLRVRAVCPFLLTAETMTPLEIR